MAVTRRSVSFDDSIVARVERAARDDGVSFSSWLSNAAEHALRIREGLQGVRKWEAEAGPLTPTELDEGKAGLDQLLATDRRETFYRAMAESEVALRSDPERWAVHESERDAWLDPEIDEA